MMKYLKLLKETIRLWIWNTFKKEILETKTPITKTYQVVKMVEVGYKPILLRYEYIIPHTSIYHHPHNIYILDKEAKLEFFKKIQEYISVEETPAYDTISRKLTMSIQVLIKS